MGMVFVQPLSVDVVLGAVSIKPTQCRSAVHVEAAVPAQLKTPNLPHATLSHTSCGEFGVDLALETPYESCQLVFATIVKEVPQGIG